MQFYHRMWFLFVPIAAYIGSGALSLVGFTSVGVGSGTVAAVWQSSIGNVVTGSVFSSLQSAGATGVGSVIGGVCGAVTSIFSLFDWKWINKYAHCQTIRSHLILFQISNLKYIL